jgi:hypothetical protein
VSLPTLDEVLGAKRGPRISDAHYTSAIFAPIAEELLEMVDVLEREGAVYARAYLEHLRSGGQGYGPHAPLGMHKDVARAVRDVVMDHAMNARFTAGRRAC